jgi:FkbM family methyltransferase
MSQIHYPFTEYIRNFVKTPIKTIFDIGSRDLEESIEFTKYYPNAQIYAIEANPEQKLMCENKAKLYNNINFYSTAFSSIIGNINFYAVINEGKKLPHEIEAPDANIGASSLYSHDESYIKSVEQEDGIFRCTEKKYIIPSITFDKFCINNNINEIDAIWIDCQGSELEIFKNGLNILKNTKIIHTETQYKTMYKNQPLYPEVKNFFEEIGFVEVFNRFPNGPWETDLILVNKNIL